MKLHVRQPAGHGPHVKLGVKKYLCEQVVHVVGFEHTLQPLGQPTQTPDITLVLLSHCKQLNC